VTADQLRHSRVGREKTLQIAVDKHHFEAAQSRIGRKVGGSNMRGTDSRSKRAEQLPCITSRMPIVTKDCRGPFRRQRKRSEGLTKDEAIPTSVQINRATARSVTGDDLAEARRSDRGWRDRARGWIDDGPARARHAGPG
jgi:hypothetical protein